MSIVLDRMTDEDLKTNAIYVNKISTPDIHKLEPFAYKSFNFNSIIPVPQDLLLSCGPIVELALLAYFLDDKPEGKHSVEYLTEDEQIFFDHILIKDLNDLEKRYHEHLEKYAEGADKNLVALGKRYFENYMTYECFALHSWCAKYWGTPINAFGVLVEKNTITFITVNSPADKVVRALSTCYPDRKFGYTVESDFDNTSCVYENGVRFELA